MSKRKWTKVEIEGSILPEVLLDEEQVRLVTFSDHSVAVIARYEIMRRSKKFKCVYLEQIRGQRRLF